MSYYKMIEHNGYILTVIYHPTGMGNFHWTITNKSTAYGLSGFADDVLQAWTRAKAQLENPKLVGSEA